MTFKNANKQVYRFKALMVKKKKVGQGKQKRENKAEEVVELLLLYYSASLVSLDLASV